MAQAGINMGSLCFRLFSLQSSTLDHLATAPSLWKSIIKDSVLVSRLGLAIFAIVGKCRVDQKSEPIWTGFVYFSPNWEVELFRLYSRLALHNVGRIDWQPHLEIIFTRLDSFWPTCKGLLSKANKVSSLPSLKGTSTHKFQPYNFIHSFKFLSVRVFQCLGTF